MASSSTWIDEPQGGGSLSEANAEAAYDHGTVSPSMFNRFLIQPIQHVDRQMVPTEPGYEDMPDLEPIDPQMVVNPQAGGGTIGATVAAIAHDMMTRDPDMLPDYQIQIIDRQVEPTEPGYDDVPGLEPIYPQIAVDPQGDGSNSKVVMAMAQGTRTISPSMQSRFLCWPLQMVNRQTAPTELGCEDMPYLEPINLDDHPDIKAALNLTMIGEDGSQSDLIKPVDIIHAVNLTGVFNVLHESKILPDVLRDTVLDYVKPYVVYIKIEPGSRWDYTCATIMAIRRGLSCFSVVPDLLVVQVERRFGVGNITTTFLPVCAYDILVAENKEKGPSSRKILILVNSGRQTSSVIDKIRSIFASIHGMSMIRANTELVDFGEHGSISVVVACENTKININEWGTIFVHMDVTKRPEIFNDLYKDFMAMKNPPTLVVLSYA